MTDAIEPYPLSWDEQARFCRELPPHLARMALFKFTELREASCKTPRESLPKTAPTPLLAASA